MLRRRLRLLAQRLLQPRAQLLVEQLRALQVEPMRTRDDDRLQVREEVRGVQDGGGFDPVGDGVLRVCELRGIGGKEKKTYVAGQDGESRLGDRPVALVVREFPGAIAILKRLSAVRSEKRAKDLTYRSSVELQS